MKTGLTGRIIKAIFASGKHPYLFCVFGSLLLLFLNACTNQSGNQSLTDTVTVNSAVDSTINSAALQKQELTAIYTQAIAEFIKAANHNQQSSFDTLYFWKHVYGQPDDFPDIELPASIGQTRIKLIPPDSGSKKQTVRDSCVYINLMGWIDSTQADFMFVVFSDDAAHLYDYFVNFRFNTATSQFELDQIDFENYSGLNGQKPARIVIYRDGQYLAN